MYTFFSLCVFISTVYREVLVLGSKCTKLTKMVKRKTILHTHEEVQKNFCIIIYLRKTLLR